MTARDSPHAGERAAAAARQQVKGRGAPTGPEAGLVPGPVRGLQGRRLAWWSSAQAGVAARRPAWGFLSGPVLRVASLRPVAAQSCSGTLAAAAARPPTLTLFTRAGSEVERAAVWLVLTISCCGARYPRRSQTAWLAAGVDTDRAAPPCGSLLALWPRGRSPTCHLPGAPWSAPVCDTLSPGGRLSRGSSETSAICPEHHWSLGWDAPSPPVGLNCVGNNPGSPRQYQAEAIGLFG